MDWASFWAIISQTHNGHPIYVEPENIFEWSWVINELR
jgi:hypothetical protein